MHIEDDEILQGFVEESVEHLSSIENDLLAIEEGGANIDENLVNKVFRAAHSIKGGAGFMGLTAVQEIAHAAENILGMIRSKTIIPTPEIVNVLLIAMDQLQAMIDDIHNSNNVDITSHVEALNAIADNATSGGGQTPAPAEPVVESPPEPESVEENIPEPITPEEVLPELTVDPVEDIAQEPEPEPKPIVE